MTEGSAGRNGYKTPRGTIHLNPDSSWELIRSLEFEEGIGSFPHYRSMLWDKEHIRRLLFEFNGRLAIAYTDDGEIIGYIGFAHPVPQEGWPGELLPLVYELGSIEVSRNWRRMGVARKLLTTAMANDALEDFIVVLSGFAWHWDLDGAELNKQKYRKMLMNLFSMAGFRHYYTNEPNVLMDSANMLMARVGSRVGDEDQNRFIEALFSFGS